ncbi:9781_t:CDS:1, partial [Cetraspora pellucida]
MPKDKRKSARKFFKNIERQEESPQESSSKPPKTTRKFYNKRSTKKFNQLRRLVKVYKVLKNVERSGESSLTNKRRKTRGKSASSPKTSKDEESLQESSLRKFSKNVERQKESPQESSSPTNSERLVKVYK